MTPEEVAEQLYLTNRKLSIKIALNEGLTFEEVRTLNAYLGLYIKELRGDLE